MREGNYSQWLDEQLIDVQEAERDRISRDLHDSLSQELSMIKLYLDSLNTLDYKSGLYNKAIKEMGSLVKNAMESVREISHDLSPHIIQSNDLSGAIKILVNKCQAFSDLNFSFHCDEDFSLPCKKKELYLYRTIQEFIHNSIKHAEADKITIELKNDKGQLQILLSDDGKGFNVEGKYNSIGLSNIEMRMKVIDAGYEYFSTPNIGTDLKIILDEKIS
jgi:signal transduction histidine kinase